MTPEQRTSAILVRIQDGYFDAGILALYDTIRNRMRALKLLEGDELPIPLTRHTIALGMRVRTLATIKPKYMIELTGTVIPATDRQRQIGNTGVYVELDAVPPQWEKRIQNLTAKYCGPNSWYAQHHPLPQWTEPRFAYIRFNDLTKEAS